MYITARFNLILATVILSVASVFPKLYRGSTIVHCSFYCPPVMTLSLWNLFRALSWWHKYQHQRLVLSFIVMHQTIPCSHRGREVVEKWLRRDPTILHRIHQGTIQHFPCSGSLVHVVFISLLFLFFFFLEALLVPYVVGWFGFVPHHTCCSRCFSEHSFLWCFFEWRHRKRQGVLRPQNWPNGDRRFVDAIM